MILSLLWYPCFEVSERTNAPTAATFAKQTHQVNLAGKESRKADDRNKLISKEKRTAKQRKKESHFVKREKKGGKFALPRTDFAVQQHGRRGKSVGVRHFPCLDNAVIFRKIKINSPKKIVKIIIS